MALVITIFRQKGDHPARKRANQVSLGQILTACGISPGACAIGACQITGGLPAAGRRLPKHSGGVAAAQAPVSPLPQCIRLIDKTRQACEPGNGAACKPQARLRASQLPDIGAYWDSRGGRPSSAAGGGVIGRELTLS